ncbi:peptidoglycan-binding domain-containing protein [Streptomyces puniciscabiei]|uniref:peptidoglycan-binding domain-containing protein n=1 Tax=Streptomyces puniciscabiei TaxID=164348 RepID=UPI00332EE4A1
MSESEGHSCPECGTPRGPDLSPSCDCTERAAEALHETRTAEAAAAEDFDPLRIRPYVKVEATETTLPLMRPKGARGSVLTCGSAAGARPAKTAPHPNDDPPHPKDNRPNRRSPVRTLLLSAAAAGTAIVAGTALAGGLLSYRTPSRDQAAQEVRERVPAVTAPDPTAPAPASSPAPPRVPPPVPPVPVSRPSPSATPSASPTPAASAGTPRPASPTTATTTFAAPRSTPVAPVLQRGDQGPQVTELQERLRQLNLYSDRIDGVFTRPVEDAVRNYQLARGIQGDTLGVYGHATRQSLEAETSEP